VTRLVWTPRAARDVARLHAFLAQKTPEAARRAVGSIRRGVRTLEGHPEAGRPVEDGPGFREWIIPFGAGGYIVRYHYTPETEAVLILAVRHSLEAGY
jgi:plasmid stabilization system protein ParE